MVWRLLLLTLTISLLVFSLHAAREQTLPDAQAWEAMRLMQRATRELKEMRLELGAEIDPALDPARSGLIGLDYSDLTTSLGDLRAKQTSLQPQFAALIVIWLQQAGVGPGDKIALCLTGSFPALNLAALCACAVMDLRPLIVSSVGASTYGANIPDFTWLDMETRLYKAGLLPWLTRYASLGGIVDTGGGIDETGIALGEAAIARHGAVYLREGDHRTAIRDVERRMDIYFQDGRPAAFINVGGNITAFGWISEATLLENGLLARVPSVSSPQRGLIFRMFEAGVPVIHLLNIERLAAANHLPVAPSSLEPALDWSKAKQRHLAALAALLLVWFALAGLLLRREQGGHRRMAARR